MRSCRDNLVALLAVDVSLIVNLDDVSWLWFPDDIVELIFSFRLEMI